MSGALKITVPAALLIGAVWLWMEFPPYALGQETASTGSAQQADAKDKAERVTGDDDYTPAPHPDWKKKSDEWERRGRPYERTPLAPAPLYKTPCRFYSTIGCGVPGQPCGVVADLTGGQGATPAECHAKRTSYAKERGLIYPEPGNAGQQGYTDDQGDWRGPRFFPCPRGGCQVVEPVDDEMFVSAVQRKRRR